MKAPRVFALLLGVSSASAAVTVTQLRCEWAVDPAGVDVAAPHLTWQLTSDRPDTDVIAGWQVWVASNASALAAGQADLWDSGKQPWGDGGPVAYAGKPLGSLATAAWKVRVWDANGQASEWSAPASWTMGLLSAKDWRGEWVAAPGATESLLLRREFIVRPGLRRAVVCVTGLGQYELYCDGRKVGNDWLAPGWTQYEKTILYEVRDLTTSLHAGVNALGLLLGNGMYNVVLRDRFTKFTGSDGPLRAIVHLQLDYADGTTEWVGSDPHWRTLAGPLTFNSIYGGEDEDARLWPKGWDAPGFDDSHWLRAVPLRTSKATLRGVSAAADPIRRFEHQHPVGHRDFPDGSVVYDFGQNAAHVPWIRLEGRGGSSIRLTPAEIVNPDGTISHSTMGGSSRGMSWWQFTKATDGVERWSPHFAYVGFRYLKVEFFPPDPAGPPLLTADAGPGPRPKLQAIEAIVVHGDSPRVGHFAASNPLLGRIETLVTWAQRSNLMSVFTDCPHREKLGWLEQDHLNGPALRYEFDLTRNFRKTGRDMADAQARDGMVPTTAPEYAKFEPPFRSAVEWGSAIVLVPWQQYEFTGDPSLAIQEYPAMKRYLQYLQGRAADGIVAEGLGDWYDLGPKRPGAAQLTAPELTATGIYFEDLRRLARLAPLAGHPEDAPAWQAQAAQVRGSFNRRFFHADRGSYGTGSQCANALALTLGLAPEADRSRVLQALVADIEAHGDGLTAGDVGYRYVLRALADGGRSDLIYRMTVRDDQPGYAFILKQGATSMTEAWDANPHASWDHFMLGQIVEWYYHDLVGIAPDPDQPGFRHVVFRPQPVGDLTWAEASYQSVRGPIFARWERSADRFRLKIDVPAGSTGRVVLPPEAGGAVHEVGAGKHEFTAAWTIAAKSS